MIASNDNFATNVFHSQTNGRSRISSGGGWGANSPGGAPTYDFAKFSQKLHEIERIWAPGGGRAPPAPP